MSITCLRNAVGTINLTIPLVNIKEADAQHKPAYDHIKIIALRIEK